MDVVYLYFELHKNFYFFVYPFTHRFISEILSAAASVNPVIVLSSSILNPNQGGLFDQSIEWGGADSARWVLTLPECIFDVRISQKGSQMKDGIFLNPWIL